MGITKRIPRDIEPTDRHVHIPGAEGRNRAYLHRSDRRTGQVAIRKEIDNQTRAIAYRILLG